MLEQKNYYLGLDCGTNSIGWAVSDEEYNLLKAKGQSLWGVRLFEEATTGEKRRGFRSSRRRRGRHVLRLKLLRELFKDEITKIDKDFYLRMDESMFLSEEKKVQSKNTLFNDIDFNDKDYHKGYPTIYHLREALIKDANRKKDIRLVYLAIRHILKHRGHFLYEGQSFNKFPDFRSILDGVKKVLIENLCMDLTCDDVEKLQEVLKSKDSKTDKAKALQATITVSSSEDIDEKKANNNNKKICQLLAGGLINAKDLFDLVNEEDEEEIKKAKICFSDTSFEDEDKVAVLKNLLGEKISVVEKLQALYKWGILANIMQDCDYYSQAQVKSYNKHKADLALIKAILKTPENIKEYKEIFSSFKKDSYNAYIGNVAQEQDKQDNQNDKEEKRPTRAIAIENFFKKIKKALETKKEDERVQTILQEIEQGTFLPLQVTKDNSVVPNQLHLNELNLILQNAQKYFSFLNQTDDKGLSVIDKIKTLLTFRIPYYVGPLYNHYDSKYYWAVKNSDERVLPWNFDEVINKEQSAQNFIERMTNTCTYLQDKDVLPKDSLLYSKYMVLNSLNNVAIYGEKISVELKQAIYKDLFEKDKTITGKKLFNYLKQQGKVKDGEQNSISGIDNDFAVSLNSHIQFNKIFNGEIPVQQTLESVIKAVLCLRQDKQMLKKRLDQLLPKATDKQKNDIANMQISGWGRLSKEFLQDIKADVEGKNISIIEALWQTNSNLTQLLHKYNFNKKVENYCQTIAKTTEFNYQNVVEELNLSPVIKRQIWQSILVVKEIIQTIGKAPEKIFIEMARQKEKDPKRTKSRKDKLIELYKNIKRDDGFWQVFAGDKSQDAWIGELGRKETDDYRKDALYLYYTQRGVCMYTGKKIELEEINNRTLYDIDHIFPRSKIKDDSLDNRVLVCKEANNKKGNKYPIKLSEMPGIVDERKLKRFWESLLNSELISKKKYERLIRTTEFTDDELAGFINRQIVEVRQSTKELTQILSQQLPDSKIVFVKAGNVADFRQNFEIVKLRDLNNLHHAKDAYLNIVVGNVFDTKFTSNPLFFIKDEYKKHKVRYSLKPETIYKYSIVRNGKTAWLEGENGTINKVKQTVSKNNQLVSQHVLVRTSGQNGGLHNQNPVSKKENLIPLKTKDIRLLNTKQYGGYNGDTRTYAFLVEHEKNGKKVRSIEFLSLLWKDKVDKNNNELLNYCQQELKLKNPRILIDKIKINSLLKFDGLPVYITGVSGPSFLAKFALDLVISPEQEKLLKAAVKLAGCVAIAKKAKKELPEVSCDYAKKYYGINTDGANSLYQMFIDKANAKIYKNRPSSQTKTLEACKEKFAQLPLYKQCTALEQILKLFKDNGQADLSSIDAGKTVGKIIMPRNLNENKTYILYHTSTTGLYKKEIDLWSI